MARRSKSELAAGSVLAVPIDESSWAVGQVWFPGVGFYLAMSAEPMREPLHPSVINDQTNFSIFTWTNAAEILRGRWKYVGLAPLPPNGGFIPEYKSMYEGRMGVWDAASRFLRYYDESKDSPLNYKTSRSPVLVEDAIKAQNGLLEWKPHLREMLRP